MKAVPTDSVCTIAELNNLLSTYVPLSALYNTNELPIAINASVNVPGRFEEIIDCGATVPAQNYSKISSVQAVTTDKFPDLLNQESTDRLHKCPICDKTFRYISTALAHQKTHTSDQSLCCELCSRSYKNSHDLVDHLKTTHADVYRVRTRAPCQRIRESEENGNLCADCGKRFKKWNYLLRHRKNAHENLQHYVCEECGKVFQSSTSVHNHIRRTHLTLHRHTCEQCGKTFVNLKGLQKHTSVMHKT
ncbi:hypothetical protein CRM22_001847 [Opisthorchis felineus]|uniref:C2H2-type domain-containing protein n=1 Tax=Opisthorchis felineus TaxID=147828 RepID=A0A4S2MD43_OPIFE|nr:hypothetical protein CRM22_001847 [Opisthorchis felineus]